MPNPSSQINIVYSGVANSARIKQKNNETYKARLFKLKTKDPLQTAENTNQPSIKQLSQQWDEYFSKNNGFAKADLGTKSKNESISLKISKPRFRNEFILFEVEPKNKKDKIAINTFAEQKIDQPILSIYTRNPQTSEGTDQLLDENTKTKNKDQFSTDPAASSLSKHVSSSCSILFEADNLSSKIAIDSFKLPLERTIPENAVTQQWTKGDTILGPLTLEAKTLDNTIYSEISYGLASGKLYPKTQLQIENCNGLTGNIEFHNSMITNLETSRFTGHAIEINFQGMTNFNGDYLDQFAL